MNAKTKYFNAELMAVGEKKAKHQHLSVREKVIYCFAHLEGLEDAQGYLYKLVTDAAMRVYSRRHDPNKLRFGHNESIMIERLYHHIK